MTTSAHAVVDLPKIVDDRGNLTFLQRGHGVPFEIRRVFFLYDVPAGSSRAGHALRSCQQLLIAVAGAFDVLIDTGRERTRIRLDRPWIGLLLPPLTWREIDNFAAGSVCLVLASESFSEDDYYRDYSAFLSAIEAGA